MKSIAIIFDLKKRQREQAQIELQRATEALKNAQLKLTQAEESLVQFEAWKTHELQQKFEELAQQLASQKEVNEYRKSIGDIQNQWADKKTFLRQCEIEHYECQKQRELCTKRLNRAEKEVEKYQIVSDEFKRIENIESERQSDEVLDEFVLSQSSLQKI
ncbi:type III secretion system stalk subunit SctO [Pleionea sediminis]|uniref:type III secretion system stalk subunit SctO n=1 Tax=Pleionea sediminis TaxID=2569479 RepID=UPI001186D45D|nr:YscO family type III secretion system apparatus protein [Pleionea sediminis]